MRSRIVLAASEGTENRQISKDLRIPPVTVGKWRRLFVAHGIEGLRDAPHSGRPPKHDAETRHTFLARARKYWGTRKVKLKF